MRILVVEDEQRIANNIKKYFENKDKAKSFVVDISLTGSDALEQVEINSYDLIILDWMLPDLEGIEVCKTLRKDGFRTPVLMLTAKSQIDDKLEGFNSGVDDYLSKPFVMEELLVRVQALIRRSSTETQSPAYKVGPIQINTNTYEVKKGGKVLELAPREYALLEYLALNKDKVLSRSQILEHVWGEDVDPFSNTVDVHIRYLRQKLGDADGKLIKTVKNKGYMLCQS
jgi:two-component system, OmpR family, response regulator